MARSFDTSTLAALKDRSGVIARSLIWLTATNRTTGLPETIGFWNGEDHQTLIVDGEERTYYGAGTTLNIPAIISEIGVQVRTHRVTFSQLAPEVDKVLRDYDPRHAKVQIHRVLLDLNTRNLVSEPHRNFKGTLNKAPITTPPVGGQAKAAISMASAARALTKTLPLKKSDESQKLRGGDRLRKYADIAGSTKTNWGADVI